MENKYIIIQLLYQMAYADGQFSEPEKQYITAIMEKEGITIESLQEEIVEVPTEESERMKILYYLLFMIRVDGTITEQERAFTLKFGVLLGFRETMVVDMIQVMEQYLHEPLPQDELVKVIQKYLN